MNYKSIKNEALEITTLILALALGCIDFYYISFREITPSSSLFLIGLGWHLLYSCWLMRELLEKKKVSARQLLPFLTYTVSYALFNLLVGCAR